MADLGVAVTRLHLAVQRHLFAELAALGFADVRPRHGAVLAQLGDGATATQLAERCGRSKQTVTRLVDELQELGYVTRSDAPDDRRTKLVLPTRRARDEVAAARGILTRLDRRLRRAIGTERYRAFTGVLTELPDHVPDATADEEGES